MLDNIKVKRICVKLKKLNHASDDYYLNKVYFELDLYSPNNTLFKHEIVLEKEFYTSDETLEKFLNDNFPNTPIEYFNRDKSPNKIAKCSICGVENVRIYRYSNSSYPECKCNDCLNEKDYNYYIPCIYNEIGHICGYTSISEIDCARFYALPEANPNKKIWYIKGGFR